jgi:hypothetical protein
MRLVALPKLLVLLCQCVFFNEVMKPQPVTVTVHQLSTVGPRLRDLSDFPPWESQPRQGFLSQPAGCTTSKHIKYNHPPQISKVLQVDSYPGACC